MPAIIFLISLLFYGMLLSKGPVSTDCLDLVIKSQAAVDTHRLQLLFGTGYPMMVLLGALFLGIAQFCGGHDAVAAVNMIGPVFGAGAVAALYVLASRLGTPPAGIIAALLLLLNPLFVDVSTYGMNHAPALFAVISAMILLLRFKDGAKLRHVALAGACLALLAAVRLQDLFLITPAFVVVFAQAMRGRKVWTWIQSGGVLAGAALALTLLAYLPFFVGGHADSDLGRFVSIGLTKNFRGAWSGSLWVAAQYLLVAFSFVMVPWALLGIFTLASQNRRLLSILLLWLAGPLFFYGNLWSVAPRFLTILLPAVILPVSIALAACLSHKKIAFRAVAALSLVIMAFTPLYMERELFLRRHAVSYLADFYSWVGRITAPGAAVISADDGLFVTYYARRTRVERPMEATHLSAKELPIFARMVDRLLELHVPVYVTRLALTTYDYEGNFQKLIDTHYKVSLVGEMPLELWYQQPFVPMLHTTGLYRLEKK